MFFATRAHGAAERLTHRPLEMIHPAHRAKSRQSLLWFLLLLGSLGLVKVLPAPDEIGRAHV